RSGAGVHRTTLLPPADAVRKVYLPITSPARTLVDVASTLDRAAVTRLVDDSLASNVVQAQRLQATLERLQRRGHRHSAVREALEPWVGATGKVESPLEARLERWLRRKGFPRPLKQYPIRRDDGRLYFADFCWPWKLVIL